MDHINDNDNVNATDEVGLVSVVAISVPVVVQLQWV